MSFTQVETFDRELTATMTVSIVIPVHNGGESFCRCLVSLKQYIPASTEVIVVVDGSTDNSCQLAEEFGAKVIQLPIASGPAQARNLGAEIATGAILFFVDADVTLGPNTLSEVITVFQEQPELGALIGSYDDAPGAANFLSQYKNLFHHYTHQTGNEDASTFWEACGAIRRDVFLEIGGFDEAYQHPSVEDIELGYRLKQMGCSIRLCKQIQVKHLKCWSVGSMLKAELFYRAVLWTELIWRDRQFNNDLNLSHSSRLSLLLTYALLFVLITTCWWPPALIIASAISLALLCLSWSVYRFFYQKRGGWFALRVIPWHWFYFLYGGFAFALGTLRYCLVIIGAGPAGLTAAHELAKKGVQTIILEQADKVGGTSRTEIYKGYRFDIGGHRFFTKVGEVQEIWREILGDEFIKVPRLSRIYYRGKFYDYPLSLFNMLSNLGVFTSFIILLSYLKAKLRGALNLTSEAETFEDWVIDRFGIRLYRIFFKTYTEKVWGIPCNQIRADWAAQSIQGLSLKRAVIHALFGSQNAKSLIKEFDYPLLGPGMMWEKCQERLERKGSQTHLNTTVTRIDREDKQIKSIEMHQDGRSWQITGKQFISSMPVTTLLHKLNPLPPLPVLEAARKLKYRDFLIVSLVVNREHLFPDNWFYIHSPEFKVGRIQNFKNWSPATVPDASKTCLGMEYFCSQGDDLWEMSDENLIALATQEVSTLNLGVRASDVEDGVVNCPYFNVRFNPNLPPFGSVGCG